MGIGEDGSQIDQVRIARNVTVEIGDQCWRNAGFDGTPAAKDPTCFTHEIGCGVGIVAIEPDMPAGGLPTVGALRRSRWSSKVRAKGPIHR